jgi:hypothetical protein
MPEHVTRSADPEQDVVARVVLVEVILGIGHQRGRAQGVADLVNVLVLQVLEDGHLTDEEVVAPVGGGAGVDPPAGVRLHVGQHLVELPLALRVGGGLE